MKFIRNVSPADEAIPACRSFNNGIAAFILGGKYANAIREEEREEIANVARENALKKQRRKRSRPE